MLWGPKFDDDSSYVPRPEVAVLDGAVGRLAQDDREVGLVFLKIGRAKSSTVGRLWWREWSEAFDTLEWIEVLYPKTAEARFDDGIGELTDDMMEKLSRRLWDTTIDRQAVVLAITWVIGGERGSLSSEFGWGART